MYELEIKIIDDFDGYEIKRLTRTANRVPCVGERVLLFDGRYKTIGTVVKVLNWYEEEKDGKEAYVITCQYEDQIDHQAYVEEMMNHSKNK